MLRSLSRILFFAALDFIVMVAALEIYR